MKFDPMTGNPIEDKEEEISFDPMTGEPITRQPVQAQEEPIAGFDPMTGEPITGSPNTRQPVQEEPIVGFDPMTGEPIKGKPITGSPITGKPFTGSPIASSSNAVKKTEIGKLPIIIGAAVLGVAAVAGIIFVLISSGLLMGKSGRVMLAAANTVKKTPHFVQALKTIETVSKGKYTVAFSGDVQGVNFEGEFRNGGKEKQLSGQVGLKGEKLDVLAGIDSKKVKVQVPALSKYAFTYKYADKSANTGYIMENIGDDEIDAINSALKALAKETDVKKVSSQSTKAFIGELKSIKFSSADREEYTVDEKDVSCKGYKAVITSKNLISIVDRLEDIVKKELDNLNDSDMPVMDNISDGFEAIRKSLDDVDDIDVTFYLYKNKLAAVVLESDEFNDKVEVCFEGGAYRMQNITLKCGGIRIKLSGEESDKKEKFTLKAKYSTNSDYYNLASLDYNYESGKFDATVGAALGMGVEALSGKLISSGSEVSLKISEIKAGGYSVSPNINLTVKKGAKMEKFSGKEFDIGKADEDDIEDVKDDIIDNAEDIGVGSLQRLFFGTMLPFAGSSSAPAADYNW